ncbi:MAG TPA: ABC transporter permease [Acidobacteriaceae bacterium]
MQLRLAIRRLVRAPLFTAITLITLAIGIGANTVIFSVVEGVLLKPLSYLEPERLVGIGLKAPGIGFDNIGLGPSNYFIDREQATTLEDIAVYDNDSVSVTGTGQPENVRALQISSGMLPILGVKPLLGRVFTRQDDTSGAAATVLLSYGYWQRKFGGNSQVVGRTLTLDGKPVEVVGVLPQDFHFLDQKEDAGLIKPIQLDRGATKLGQFNYQAVARMKPGVTIDQVNAELDRLIPVTYRSFAVPEGFTLGLFETAHFRSDVRPLKKDVVGEIGKTLWVLMGSIVVVLLVACANVANLLLVRVEGRRQELAVCTALGAGRGRIAASLFAESLILGVWGSAIGLLLAFGALHILVAVAPTGLPRLHEIGIDVPVLLFTAALTLLVSLFIGMIPVLRFARQSVQSSLREGGRALSQGRERHRARKALVVVQVALALVLLICSGLMIRTFLALTHINPGFTDPDTLQTFRIDIPESTVPVTNRAGVVRMQQEIANKLAAIPGVSAVSYAVGVPLDGHQSNDPVFARDRFYKEGELPPIRRHKFVAPGFFQTIGTSLVAGRDLTWDDTYGERPVAVVSENMAKEYWHDAANALGKQVRIGNKDEWRQIVGVVANTYDDGVNEKPPTVVYWPILRANYESQKESVTRGVAYVVRSPRAGSAAFSSEVQRAVWSVDSNLPLADPRTVGQLYAKSMARTSFTLVMLCVAGAMALLLGIVGIYGVIAYAVSQRTREVGIRMAMGAQRGQLTSLFVRQGLVLAAIGAVFGVAASFVTMRLMSSLLFHVSPMDPGTYVVATAGVVMIAWLACYLPSRRAATVNPVNALRAE